MFLKKETYQKCTVLKPTGLFHMRLKKDSCAPSELAVLWKRLPPLRAALEVKKVLRNTGRAARKKLFMGAIVSEGRLATRLEVGWFVVGCESRISSWSLDTWGHGAGAKVEWSWKVEALVALKVRF